jgi:hypothetical protein
MKNTNSNSKKDKITIEAQLPVALEELAIYVLPKEKDTSKILEVLNTNPMTPNYVMRKIARGIIRKKKAEVKLLNIEHDYNDSQNMTHGVAYFKVELEGTEKALKRIAGEEKLFEFDWQDHANSHTGEDQ